MTSHIKNVLFTCKRLSFKISYEFHVTPNKTNKMSHLFVGGKLLNLQNKNYLKNLLFLFQLFSHTIAVI